VRLITTAIAAIFLTAPAVALAQKAPATGEPPRATPIGNPASWFPADAYPPEAKAAGVQGRTAFSLGVDDKGRITGCNITSSSGSPLLDSTTCNLLVTNAHFTPAQDAGGRKVAGVWASAMVWKLTTAAAPPAEVYGTSTGPSAAEIYNETVSEQQRAESDQDQGQSQGEDQNQDQGMSPEQNMDPSQGIGQ
jgi:TonB family protein